MRIAHVVPTVASRGGGPSRSVPALAYAQASAGHDVTVFTLEDPNGGAVQAPDAVSVTFLPSLTPPHRYAYSRTLYPALVHARPELIHSHSIWNHPSFVAHRAAHTLHVPHVLSPRGMLDAWAVSQASWKKRLAGHVIQTRVLRSASCIHALVPNEATMVRAHNLTMPIAVVPNGVDESWLEFPRQRTPLESLLPRVRGKRVCLFLSRLHPKKGLADLLQSWATLSPRFPDWHLLVAGPAETNYDQKIGALIHRLQIQDSVTLSGSLHGDALRAAYAGADLFVLPSYSEGLSMAVLEALATGTPVALSRACNLPEVEPTGCGLLFDPGEASLTTALSTLLAYERSALQIMGHRARDLVRNRYRWSACAAQLLEVYSWLLDRSLAPPACLLPASQQPPGPIIHGARDA